MVLKPEIHIFWQTGVSRMQLAIMDWAVEHLLCITDMYNKFEIVYGTNLEIEKYKNIDQKSDVFGRVLANECIDNLVQEYKLRENQYILVAVKDLLFYIDENSKNSPLIGWAKTGSGGLVYVDNDGDTDAINVRNRIIITAMHEIMHIFEDTPRHCGNISCSMYKDDNTKYVDIIKKPFCDRCFMELYNYFKKLNLVP